MWCPPCRNDTNPRFPKWCAQIILIGSVKNQEEAKEAARRCPTLTVRGEQVWLWCHHLAAKTCMQLNEGTLGLYPKLHSVPVEWVNNMVHANNQPA